MQPTPQEVHIDTYAAGGKKRKERKMTAEEIQDEAAVTRVMNMLKRALTGDSRDALSDSDFAIPSKRAYPIHDKSHADDALARSSGKPEEGTVRAAVYHKYPEMKKAEGDVEIEVDIWKAEAEGKVYGVVLEPNLVDSQGDMVSAGEIEKACHRYMVESRKVDIQHSDVDAGAQLIENFIAPQPMELGGRPITKGSWVQAWQITDPVVKQEIADGKLTGLSIGGRAARIPVAA